jgi:uncharacterized membrane protein YdjX (TVP38/TMEM64 family)
MPDAESPPPVSPWRWGRWLLLVALASGAVALRLLGLDDALWDHLRNNRAALKDWADAHFTAALLLFFGVYVVVIGLSLPLSTVFGLAAGFLFGRGWGLVLISCASTAGATVAFLVSRYLLRDPLRVRLGRRLEVIDRGVARDGAYYLLSLRLVALVPFWLINLGMGLTGMRLRTFWWATQLGMLPANFLFVNAGTELGEIDSPRGLLSPGVLVSLAALGLVPLALRFVVRRLRRG